MSCALPTGISREESAYPKNPIAARGLVQFLPVDSFRINPSDLLGDVMGLPVFINGTLAPPQFEVIVDDRVSSYRKFGVEIVQHVHLGLYRDRSRP